MYSSLTPDDGSQRPPAPAFPETVAWVNMRAPLELEALRGRVVLLYFWTYSNIHCIQSLADIKYLESKYRDKLAIVGVHAPKFAQERVAANVMRAVNRNYVRHPVASDSGFLLWQLYGADAWPTYVVIDPAGRIAGRFAGEGRRAELDALVSRLAAEIDHQGEAPPALQTTARAEPKTALRFPGKVLATADRLYVSDTGHNRVLECTHEGRVLRQFGSGNTGFWDGRGTDAGFCEPQGLALAGTSLFVADAGNHSVRRVTLSTGETQTFLGTGVQGRARPDATDPLAVPLSSPWELCVSVDRLYVTLAGQHQIGVLDLGRLVYSVFAGSGHAGLVDGPVGEASFAKPLGIVQHAQTIYVADADSSSLRAIKLFDRSVRTVAGKGLHEFGDSVGPGPEDLVLQHPSALALEPQLSELWIADSYNGTLKMLALRGGASRAFTGDYRFHEPGGLSVAAGAVWVANTNAHEIVRIDVRDGSAKRVPVGE
ncbi:MAG TPA: thioredoxin-like domain-containing protein [Candidatus Saccharimonadia bacterium]|nr:thioredoxin-like domain-containing protein [Candidatus Saccharimonadia bacterium]